jgi:hypothetical protein
MFLELTTLSPAGDPYSLQTQVKFLLQLRRSNRKSIEKIAFILYIFKLKKNKKS